MSLNTEKAVSRITYNGIPFELVIRGKNVVVPLSSAFAAATSIYYFQVNDDVVLFSANVDNVGVWAYNAKNATFTQLYASGGHWAIFRVVNNDCLIGSNHSSSKGLLLYEAEKGTINQIYDEGVNFVTFHKVGNDYLLSPSSTAAKQGLLLYEAETKTIEVLYAGNYWCFFQILGDKCLITGTADGTLLYYFASKTVKYIDGKIGGYMSIFVPIGNDCLVSNSGNGVVRQGIYLYDSATDTIDRVFDKGVCWGEAQIIGNKCLLAYSGNTNQTSNALKGFIVYDIETRTVTQLHTEGIGWVFTPIGEDCLITCTYTSNTGLWLYEGATGAVTQLYTSGNKWLYAQQVGNDCLISNATNGVLLYDGETKTASLISSVGYLNHFQIIGGDCLVSASSASNSNTAIYLYDGETKTMSSVYSNSGKWEYTQPVGNDCLIGGAVGSGLVLYDGETKTATKIFASGSVYDTFEFDENGNVYVSASDKTKSAYTLYYDAATKTASIAGYYVELE